MAGRLHRLHRLHPPGGPIWRLMFARGEGAARPLQGLVRKGKGCFETLALIGCVPVNACFRCRTPLLQVTEPAQRVLHLWRPVQSPEDILGSPVVYGDWHERSPIVASRSAAATTCGTSSSNIDRCLDLKCPIARAGLLVLPNTKSGPSGYARG